MYRIKISPLVISKINKYTPNRPGINSALRSLESNPLEKSRGVRMSRRIYGDYRIKAGNKFEILFDIDEVEQVVEILDLMKKTDLYRLIGEEIKKDAIILNELVQDEEE